jgi:hypothetical protein
MQQKGHSHLLHNNTSWYFSSYSNTNRNTLTGAKKKAENWNLFLFQWHQLIFIF